jgi:outer membrane protein OmpA-like peptidoglycan-associated protein
MIARAFVALLLLAAAVARAGQPDEEGCKDHPLVSRMPGYHIYRCRSAEFEAPELYKDAHRNKAPVEGRLTEVQYDIDQGRATPSPLQIARNYEAALGRIGGQVVSSFEDGGGRISTVRVVRGGSESWVQVVSYNPEQYTVTIVEKAAMTQEVVASAAVLGAGLAAAGHVEVPGIYFDTGKSTLKSESDAALRECAGLLRANAALKVYVVGHTDGVGGLAPNLTLSAARADAVAKALVTRFGVDGRRLASFGAGPCAPVASNATEDGRARNRRVELVAQ